MISSSQGFNLRHRDGFYLVTHWSRREQVISYAITHDALHGSVSYRKEDPFSFMRAPDWEIVADQWETVDHPCCGCCGYHYQLRQVAFGVFRCSKHLTRHACAIDGCKRSTAAKGEPEDRGFLCSEHWRRYVPPGSPARKAYHRLHRIGKRRDWPNDLRARYWRFWGGLVKRAIRDSQEGRLDMTAVNALFGWSDDE